MNLTPELNALTNTLTQSPHAGQLKSILAYPHPFTKGGVIVIWQDELEPWLELLALVQISVPAKRTAHCLRQSELPLLSQPNLFGPPLQVNERPHLPYWLQHKGACLFGEDLRHQVQPVEPQHLLAGHLEGCMDYLRRYGILTLLMEDQYAELLGLLEREMRYLMGTALLLHGEWEISLDTLPDQFQPFFPTAYQTWQKVQEGLTAVSRHTATQAVWLFEQFLRQLREYTR